MISGFGVILSGEMSFVKFGLAFLWEKLAVVAVCGCVSGDPSDSVRSPSSNEPAQDVSYKKAAQDVSYKRLLRMSAIKGCSGCQL